MSRAGVTPVTLFTARSVSFLAYFLLHEPLNPECDLQHSNSQLGRCSDVALVRDYAPFQPSEQFGSQIPPVILGGEVGKNKWYVPCGLTQWSLGTRGVVFEIFWGLILLWIGGNADYIHFEDDLISLSTCTLCCIHAVLLFMYFQWQIYLARISV